MLPPERQKKKVCEVPIPNSIKKSVVTFNKREYWSWGANLTERNCVPQDTIVPKPPPPPPQYVFTFSGNGNAGFDNGPNAISTLAFPQGVAVDSNNVVYISDTANNSIRKVTPLGFTTTLAGNGFRGSTDNTNPLFATFNNPTGISVDSLGNVFVADSGNNKIRKIDSNGVVTTLAGSGASGFTDGTGTGATFSFPTDVQVDLCGNIYVADMNNHAIRLCTSLGVVTTLAGDGYKGYVDGSAGNSEFTFPTSAVSISGNVYVADTGNDAIRVIKGNVVSTLAYSLSPGGITYDSSTLVVTSETGNTVTRINLQDGRRDPFAGGPVAGLSDGLTLSASFAFPCRIAYNNSLYYVADMFNNAIRRIAYTKNPSNYVLKTSDTSPFIVRDNTAGIISYSILGAGGGGDVTNPSGGVVSGGGGGGSAFVTGIATGVGSGYPLQFNVGKKGYGANYFPYVYPTAGGDSFVIFPTEGTIVSKGGIGYNLCLDASAGFGAYGGGGGVPNGSGGIGTISSGKNGSTIGGNGGGDPDSGKGGIGGGGGGHGGGMGSANMCNATFYGAGGGGTAIGSGGNGGDGLIVLTLYG